MIRTIFVVIAFILASMAMALFVFRDSRPRADEWQTIVRTGPPPRKELDGERMP